MLGVLKQKPMRKIILRNFVLLIKCHPFFTFKLGVQSELAGVCTSFGMENVNFLN